MILARVVLILLFLAASQGCCLAAGRPDAFSGSPPGVEDLTGPLPWVLQARTPVRLSSYTTDYFHAAPSQEANIALTAHRMRGIVVERGRVFSFNASLGPYTAERGYGEGRTFFGDRIGTTVGGGVCQVASTLYNAVLLADLRVVERTPHSMTVPYLAPGRDATILYGVFDFKFRNDSSGPVMIWAGTADRHLTISIYGRQSAPRVEIRTKILRTWPPPEEVEPDPGLPAGKREVVTPGQPGVRSHTLLLVNGRVRDLGVDEYVPRPRRVKCGSG